MVKEVIGIRGDNNNNNNHSNHYQQRNTNDDNNHATKFDNNNTTTIYSSSSSSSSSREKRKSIITTFNGTLLSYGNMFDITTTITNNTLEKNKTINIYQLAIHTQQTNILLGYKIYTKQGGYAECITDLFCWGQPIRRGQILTSGEPGTATILPVFDKSVRLRNGERRAFYVTLTNTFKTTVDGEKPSLRYGMGTETGGVAVENGDVRVLQGAGIGDYPLGFRYWEPRVWNGLLWYDVVVDDSEDEEKEVRTGGGVTMTGVVEGPQQDSEMMSSSFPLSSPLQQQQQQAYPNNSSMILPTQQPTALLISPPPTTTTTTTTNNSDYDAAIVKNYNLTTTTMTTTLDPTTLPQGRLSSPPTTTLPPTIMPHPPPPTTTTPPLPPTSSSPTHIILQMNDNITITIPPFTIKRTTILSTHEILDDVTISIRKSINRYLRDDLELDITNVTCQFTTSTNNNSPTTKNNNNNNDDTTTPTKSSAASTVCPKLDYRTVICTPTCNITASFNPTVLSPQNLHDAFIIYMIENVITDIGAVMKLYPVRGSVRLMLSFTSRTGGGRRVVIPELDDFLLTFVERTCVKFLNEVMGVMVPPVTITNVTVMGYDVVVEGEGGGGGGAMTEGRRRRKRNGAFVTYAETTATTTSENLVIDTIVNGNYYIPYYEFNFDTALVTQFYEHSSLFIEKITKSFPLRDVSNVTALTGIEVMLDNNARRGGNDDDDDNDKSLSSQGKQRMILGCVLSFVGLIILVMVRKRYVAHKRDSILQRTNSSAGDNDDDDDFHYFMKGDDL